MSEEKDTIKKESKKTEKQEDIKKDVKVDTKNEAKEEGRVNNKIKEDKKSQPETEKSTEKINKSAKNESASGEKKSKTSKKDILISPSDVKPGMVIKLWQKIKEKTPKGEMKERLQYFEGTVLARKGGNEPGSTITIRKISNGIGVEKIFPLNLPTIAKIELLHKIKTRRAKLYFLRRGYKKRLKKVL